MSKSVCPYEDSLESLEKFINHYKAKDPVRPATNKEIQTWLEEGLGEDLYVDEVYDYYLDNFVREYWRTCNS